MNIADVMKYTPVLKIGKKYLFHIKGEEPGTKRKKMKLIRKHRHFALFEDANGIKECFTYFELMEMKRKRLIAE